MTECKSLKEQLVNNGFIAAATASLVVRYAEKWSTSFFDALLETHVLDETMLRDCVAGITESKVCEYLNDDDVDSELLKQFDYEDLRRSCSLPLSKSKVVVANPLNRHLLISELPGAEFDWKDVIVSSKSHILAMLDRHYPIVKRISEKGADG